MKNDHWIYAYAELKDKPGYYILILGITEKGFDYLKQDGMTLIIEEGKLGILVDQVVMFKEKDKDTLKARLRQIGVIVSERN
jgi:hypothetical protein